MATRVSGVPVVLEACVTSIDETASSFVAGAARVELCRALEIGGLTPEREVVAAVLAESVGPVFVMVRPRGGSFRTHPAEVSAMVAEVEELVPLGVDGLVVGVLDHGGRLDRPAVTDLVSAAGGLPVTFHRAFDELDDLVGGIDQLVRAGVARVLTSGGAASAWEGRSTLRALVGASGHQITVLGGGGIRGDHVRELLRTTGLQEVHARASAIPGIVEALK